jgi:apolipoprotein N-acyltransferase
VAWAAYFFGGMSILRAYGGVMPLPVMILALAGPAIAFAGPVIAAKRVRESFGEITAMFAYAALWAGIDLASSFSHAGGAVATPAAAEVGAPMLMQSASLVGFVGVTFLLGLFASGIALTLRTRHAPPATIAVALFCANAVFGYARMATPAQGGIRTAIIDSNDVVGTPRRTDKAATFKAIDAYAAEIERLRGRNVKLIVLPENISKVLPEWRDEAQARLAHAANDVDATLVAGFNTYINGAQRNISWAFTPGSTAPVTYEKRRLVKGLETDFYTPGSGGSQVLPDGVGLEICKDMDFHAMVRADEVATHPAMLAVPAWDFGSDDWSHGRVAIMRSIENGVPMARSAREGLMTLNDRYGRIVAVARVEGPLKTLIGDLPLEGRGGNTVYDRIGDIFGWLCLALGIAATALAFFKRKRAA